MRKGERGEEELNIVSTQRGTPLPARPSRNQTASRRTGSVQTKSGGRGNGGRGSGRRAPLQAPGPFPSLPLYIPQSPPHSALQLKCRPRPPHSVRAGTGRVPRSRPQHNPGSTARSRLTSSAHPRSCRSVISAGVPTPPRTELAEKSPAPRALGAGALAARSPRVGEGQCSGGAGARRSGGSRALSKRDRAGLRRPRPAAPRRRAHSARTAPPFSELGPARRALHRPTQTWPPLQAGEQTQHGPTRQRNNGLAVKMAKSPQAPFF